MDQRALGKLAEELAEIASQGTPGAAALLGHRIRREAARQRVDPRDLTHLVAVEWVRLGIVRPDGLLAVGR